MSAGTNNARVASQLRSLSSYYYKEPSLLFLLRCAQGLTHMGKGLLTLNPYHSDKLMSNTAMAGLLATVFCGLDVKATVLTKYHHVLYYLVRATRTTCLCAVGAGKATVVCGDVSVLPLVAVRSFADLLVCFAGGINARLASADALRAPTLS